MGAVAGGAAFEPFALRWLVALAPLGFFLTVRLSPTPRGAFLRAMVGGYVFYQITLCWLFTLARFFPVAALGILLLPIYAAFYPALAAWIVRRWFSRVGAFHQFALFCALWILGEWFRTLGRLAMPWSLLAHPWARWTWAIQSAEFVGEIGLSLHVLTVSAFLFALLRLGATTRAARDRAGLQWLVEATDARGLSTSKALGAASALAVVIVFAFAGSALRERQWADRLLSAPPANELRVAALQPNVDQEVKLATYADPDPKVRAGLNEQNTRLHEDLIRAFGRSDIDLFVLPESTFPDIWFTLDSALHRRIERMMAPMEADLLLGGARPVLTPERRLKAVYNSAFFLPAGQSFSDERHQDKMRLVPFGEYLPYFEHIPFLKTLVGIESFAEGEKIELFETRGHRFGVMICFESSFGVQARKIVNEGAEFLVVVTNDAWYGRSAGLDQHHDLSLLRAVETRRPIVRSANTGISSIIDPVGRVTASCPQGEMSAATGTIAPQSGRTFFVRWGNLWLVLASVAFVVASAIKVALTTRSEP